MKKSERVEYFQGTKKNMQMKNYREFAGIHK